MLELNYCYQNLLEEVCVVNNYIKYFKVIYLLRKFCMKSVLINVFYYLFYEKKLVNVE